MKVLSSNDVLLDTNKPFNSLKIEVDREDSCVIYNEFMDNISVIDFLLHPFKAISGSLYYYGDDLFEYSKDELKEWKERDVSIINDYNDLINEFDIISNIEYPMLLNKNEIDEKYLNELLKIFKVDKSKNIKEIDKLDLIRIKSVRSLLKKPYIVLIEDVTRGLDEEKRDEILREFNSFNSIYKIPIIHETKIEDILKVASIRYIITSDGFVGA